MKKLLFILLLIFVNVKVFCQVKYEIGDSINKNKDDIYSNTKMFISEFWKTGISQIEIDDKETGLILVRGKIIISLETPVMTYPYAYSYNVKFMMKDKKFKIVIFNVNPDINIGKSYISPNICADCEFPGVIQVNMTKKLWTQLQNDFKNAMNNILTSYSEFVKKDYDNW